MARPNVTVVINDQSFVISGTEAGGAHRSGFNSKNGLLFAVGTTTERQQGFMVVEGTNDWFGRLKSTEFASISGTSLNDKTIPFYHSATGGTNHPSAFTGGASLFAGKTFERWPLGPTGDWADEWWSVHNYLLYGGVAVVGGTGSVTNTSALDSLKNKSVSLDSMFGASGENADITTVVESRGDIIGVHHIMSTEAVGSATKANTDEKIITVYGEKTHVDISRLNTSVVTDTNLITTPLSSDVAGCLARTDRVANPWFSPGGATRGRILDVVRLAKELTEADQDTLYDKNINPVVTFPGEGTLLFGDKTNKPATSTLSRINVSRLFLYLKRTIGTAARSILFEQNDEITRNLFINAVTPLLQSIVGERGITDFRVICDASNNPSSIIEANEFVADVFVKPTKSINFVRLRFTNKSEGAELS